MEVGLSNFGLLIGNGNVKYDTVDKTCNCLHCNYKRYKYEWAHVLDNANTMRQRTPNRQIYRPKENGMHIEFRNDLTMRMAIDYGRIKIIRKAYINNSIGRYIICL